MPKRRSILPILLIFLLLAAVLRVGWPGVTEFKYDEAATLRRAMDFVREGVWPRGTISSMPGVPQPPLKAYLLAIPLAMWPQPEAAVIFLGLLGTASVGLTYYFGRRAFDWRAGLIAAALLAAAPWAIFFDRKLWAQNVSVVTLAFMLALYALVADRRWKAVALLLPALGALIGLYIGGGVFAAVLVLALALHPRAVREAWRGESPAARAGWLALGLGGLALALATYLAPHWRELSSLSLAGLSGGGDGGERVLAPLVRLRYAAQVATGYQFHALAGESWPDYYSSLALPNLNGVLDGSVVALMLAGMVYIAIKAVVLAARRGSRADGRPAHVSYTLLALWIFVPVGIWTASGLEPQIHRYLQLYPAQPLALGVLLVEALDWLSAPQRAKWVHTSQQRLKRALAALVALWLALVVGWQTVEYVGMIRFVSTGQNASGHSPPARGLWNAAREARRLAEPGGLPVVIYTLGDDPDYEEGATTFDAVLGDLDPVFVDGGSVLVEPPGAYVAVDALHAPAYTVTLRPPREPSAEAGLARLANGIDLLGVSGAARATISPGQPLALTLRWRIWNWPPGPEAYAYTVRVMSADGQTWGQVDGPFLRTAHWQVGMQVTTQVSVPVADDAPPGGAYGLVAGMYAYTNDGQARGVDILDIAGNPAGQEITIPLE